MSALVTENAPDFTANAVMGDNSFRKFKLSWRSKRPASSMVMVDRGEIFSKGEMATK